MWSKRERIGYTIMHRRAIKAIIEVYVLEEDKEEVMKRYLVHDMDKVLMNLLDIPGNEIKKIHRENKSHHYIDGKEYSRIDYIEMIIDWESARYTKEDKPLNAKNTLIKYYNNIYGEIMPLLREMGLDNDSDEKDERVIRLINYNLSDEDIKNEIDQYVDRLWINSKE